MTPATLARGKTDELTPLFSPDRISFATRRSITIIIVGSSCYGFTIGLWRGLEMALHVAIKTPLLLFLTLLITGLLNGILALLLGTEIRFRQSLLCQLFAFALASVVLASLAPVTYFLALEAPLSGAANASTAHSFYLLIHTALIALVGFLAVTRLFGLINQLTPDRRGACITLLSWLGSNAFVGAQLSYLLRPFFGSPNLKVAFLRKDAFNGTFYEAVWTALTRLFGIEGTLVALFIATFVGALLLRSLFNNQK